MNNLFKIGIAVTFILGFLLSKNIPMSGYLLSDKELERQNIIQAIVMGIMLVYFSYTLWNFLSHRVWVKILLIFSILFWSLIIGYLFTGFVIQPMLLSTSWTSRLLAGNASNIVWYWAFGFSISTYLLYVLTKALTKIIRGETFLF